ncbi:MAG: hypothetical protein J0M18_11940, partial [Ignavibacteria bacterium]|nr:hypothetical protein [Ignavibacteria bacterium]
DLIIGLLKKSFKPPVLLLLSGLFSEFFVLLFTCSGGMSSCIIMIQIKDKTKDNDFRKFNQFNNAGIFGDEGINTKTRKVGTKQKFLP